MGPLRVRNFTSPSFVLNETPTNYELILSYCICKKILDKKAHTSNGRILIKIEKLQNKPIMIKYSKSYQWEADEFFRVKITLQQTQIHLLSFRKIAVDKTEK